MAHHINLLPWREQARAERQRQFLVILAGAVIAVGAGLFATSNYIQSHINYQQARNQKIQKEINDLDSKIAEIRDLKETKRRLLERMRIIEQLQQQRSEVVHLFDELVKTLPDGVYLSSIQQERTGIVLKGQAQSNARVSNYMKQLDASEWLADPKLLVIETKGGDSARFSEFSLVIKSMRPDEEEADGESAR
ncbi:MAG: PilN domain-containing protein [Pseudomonadota bacterium]|nr:PilN domain-containing protein [Pseudomonadota bacterium]